MNVSRLKRKEKLLSVKMHKKRFITDLPVMNLFRGGDKRIRTVGLLHAKQPLYQLSYIPVFSIYILARFPKIATKKIKKIRQNTIYNYLILCYNYKK